MSILVATDFSASAEAALRTAAAEARRRSTVLTLFHAVDTTAEKWEHLEETPPDMPDRIEEAGRERLEQHFEEVVPREDQPKLESIRVVQGHAAEKIVELEQENAYELVVVGSTGRGALSQMLLGSTAEEVVRSCDTPVLVVPDDSFVDGAESILAPIDMSDCSQLSLQVAASLARREGAKLHIFHATTLPTGALTLTEWEPTAEHDDSHREFTSRQLETFLDELDLSDVDYEKVLSFGNVPGREIAHYADEEESDLIVMGTHGRRGFERFLLGSTATKVLRNISRPVMTIRRADDE